jgi:hypothetical protein
LVKLLRVNLVQLEVDPLLIKNEPVLPVCEGNKDAPMATQLEVEPFVVKYLPALLVCKGSIDAPIATQLEVEPFVVKYLPELLVCKGSIDAPMATQLAVVPLVVRNCPVRLTCSGKTDAQAGLLPSVVKYFPLFPTCGGNDEIGVAQLVVVPFVIKNFPLSACVGVGTRNRTSNDPSLFCTRLSPISITPSETILSFKSDNVTVLLEYGAVDTSTAKNLVGVSGLVNIGNSLIFAILI